MAGRLIDRKDENKLKDDLSHMANFYVNSFKLSPKDIKTHKVLKNLRKNNDLVVLKPDKGNTYLLTLLLCCQHIGQRGELAIPTGPEPSH